MMSAPDQLLPIRNRVILATRPEAQEFLAERMIIRPLDAGLVLSEKGSFTHAIFPHLGVISVMSETSEGRSVEKASIGNEGMVGFSYIMGGTRAMGRTVVQVPGYASFVSFQDLDEAMERFVCVREAMLRYARGLIVQLMEMVACNSLHNSEQRVGSWLLHAHDRMLGGDFVLTQEALATVLGVRRATVSEVCSELARDGLISYSRGLISILDRAGLRAHACECYDRVSAVTIPLL